MYEDMQDNDVLKLIAEDDNDAMEYLIKKYMGIVTRESRTLYIIGAENEDLIQEGMIGLIKAIREYRPEKGASFATFAVLCVRSQMITAVNSYNRKKHQPLNYYVSFYAGSSEKDDDSMLLDELKASDSSNPEQLYLNRDEKEYINAQIESRLSKFEKQVLSEYLTGDSYEMIAKRLDKPVKSIDNAIQRIRKKLKVTSA